jgi:hypothetical protein
VVSAGPLCSEGREASLRQQNSKAWSLGFTCVCGSRLLALSKQVECALGAAKLARLNCLVPTMQQRLRVYLCWGVGFQEPLQLLQAWKIQVCGHQEFWGLFARCQCPGATAVTGEQSLQELSVTCGAVGTQSPAYSWPLVSLEF